MCDFNHLHCHTRFSLLDGAASIKLLAQKAKALGMAGVAITDHGNLYGVPEFYEKVQEAGVKPIIGCEFYLTPSGMQDRTDRTRYHQVLLAKNKQGYRNLTKLSSLSFTHGHYYKPRIDKEILRTYSEGLIATTCCIQGEVPHAILAHGEEKARAVFEEWFDIFGEDYYIEIQDHGLEKQKRCNAVLLRWAKEYGVPAVATNDVHYIGQEDAEAQDVLLCLQTRKDFLDPDRLRFDNDQFFFKSAGEMRAALKDLDPVTRDAALDTTREIVDKCTVELPKIEMLMPHYPIPTEFKGDMDACLQSMVMKQARERYPEIRQDIAERLNHELGIIRDMGFAGYFLIVQDITTTARKLGVHVGPGRGSAAGSAVAYCLGITNIDPFKYDLIFERFLNPERISMPDIDIDFDDRGRSRVIDYIVEQYGRENVCQIVTFGHMGARSVIRDVARVLDIPLNEADRIAKMIPEAVGMTLEKACKEASDFRALKQHEDAKIRNLMHYAEVLEGSPRHTGVHAAGVIIAPGDVSEYVPVAVSRNSQKEEIVTTQYDGSKVEHFGLLKMDILGLKTLTILNDALHIIEDEYGESIRLEDIPLEDQKTFELFQRGDTAAIFQFESSGMREWLRSLKPTRLEDIIAMNALYRPGPMDLIPSFIARKHGKETVEYPHPMLEPVLKPTYGLPVYQEQVMQMAQVMGGYSLGGADLLRRAMGKKKRAEMDKQRSIFVEGAVARDVSEGTAHEVFDMMAKFAGYGFNKSHSAAYSVLACQAAWIKAHYPDAFMAATMTNEQNDTKRLSSMLQEAKHMGLDILPPSIHRSRKHFTVSGGSICFGIGAIKGVGSAAIDHIVEMREEHGPFQGFFGMVRELDPHIVNKKALEGLVRAGALDELEGHRAQLFEAIDLAVRYAKQVHGDRAAGQSNLFGTDTGNETQTPLLPAPERWKRFRILKEERELLGFYVSGHPLEEFAPEARAFATASLGHINEEDLVQNSKRDHAGRNGFARHDARRHTFFGIVTSVQRRTNKSGKPFGFATIEDFTGQGEVICFSDVYDKAQNYLDPDEIVMVTGEPELRGGKVKIIARDVLPMWKVRATMVKAIVLRIESDRVRQETIGALRELCEQNRGKCGLYFDIQADDLPGKTQRIHSRSYVVEPTPELMNGMARLIGGANVAVEGRNGHART